MKRIYVLSLSIFTVFQAFCQCPTINSAMVNSCGSTEGVNEFIVFTTSITANASTYSLYYGSNTPATNSPSGTLLGANARTKTGTGTITSTAGCTLHEVTSPSTSIPTGSTVIFIPADFDATYDVSSLCNGGNIYVVYINRISDADWSSTGTLANSPSGNRYIQITQGSNTCTSSIRMFSNGWSSNADGNALYWNATSTPAYVNNGCSVIANPQAVTITPSGALFACFGTASVAFPYTVTGSPDKYSLIWNLAAQNSGFTNVTNAALPSSSFTINIPATATPGTYTASLVATNTGTATSSTPQNITLTIGQPPIVADILSTTSVCEGYSYYSMMDATPGGVWSSNNTAIATVSATGVLSGITPGNAIISYTVTNTCGSTTKTINITVTNKPIVADIVGIAYLCIGSSAAFTNPTPGGAWSSNDPSIAAVDNSGNVTGGSGGTTIINYTVTNLCGSTIKTFTVTVGSSLVIADITGSPNICVAASTILSNATGGGTWNSSNPAVATINSSGSVTGITTGTSTISYTVITNSCGSIVKTFNITVADKPIVADIAGTANLCASSTTALSNTTTGGTWSSSNNAVATVNGAGLVTAVSAGTVTISYAVTNTCGTTVKTFTVTVNDKPIVADIIGASTLCAGSSGLLTNTTAGGVWSSSNAAVATINGTGSVTAVAIGAATISYTVTNSCGSTVKTWNITVADKPTVADITGLANICASAGTTLTSTTSGGLWSSSPTSVATVSTSGIVTGVSAGLATISYTVANSCGSTTKTFAVTVTDKPIVADITGPSTVNMAGTIALTDATPSGTWSSSNPSIATVSNSGTVLGISAGTATISYTVTNSCGSTVKSFVVTVQLPTYDDVYIPNAFTPNGDGNNDVFRVYGTVIQSLEMKVFNQWGELIFETTNLLGNWDGRYKGKMQPVGVYVYATRIKLINGTVLNRKGSINLVR